MSTTTQNSDSGIKGVRNTAEKLAISQAGVDFALTMALQKTEWQKMTGVKPVLFTLARKGHFFGGVIFVSSGINIEADLDRYTFLVDGVDIDDIVANYATETAANYATEQKARETDEKAKKPDKP